MIETFKINVTLAIIKEILDHYKSKEESTYNQDH